MGSTSAAPREGIAAEAVASARAAEADPAFPRAYIERVRAATRWLGVNDSGAGDVRFAALVLDRQARVELEPPMGARDLPRRLFKAAVRRMVGWYVRFLGQQVAALGQAAARLGLAVAERTERLGADQAGLSAEVAALRARVERLEAGQAGGPTNGSDTPS